MSQSKQEVQSAFLDVSQKNEDWPSRGDPGCIILSYLLLSSLQESFYRVQPVVTFANELYVLIGGNTTESMVGWSASAKFCQTLRPLL